jgi:sporulation protein YlmC with PRC-barrel domain
MTRDYEEPKMNASSANIDDVRDTRNDFDDEDRANFRRVMSASTLAGDRVRNSAGDDLGKIEEIMIDVPTGRVAYAVLSFGGFLGMGSKLFAIPWEALTLDEREHEFILNVDKQRLENAPGFDKDSWPDMADPSFGKEIYGYYGYEPYWDEGSGYSERPNRDRTMVP